MDDKGDVPMVQGMQVPNDRTLCPSSCYEKGRDIECHIGKVVVVGVGLASIPIFTAGWYPGIYLSGPSLSSYL